MIRHRTMIAVALAATALMPIRMPVVAQAPPPAGSAAPAARGGNQALQGPRIKALSVSGGGYHDYPLQGKIMMDIMAKALPVDWTLVVQGGGGTRAKFPVYDNPDWAKGFDVVVHNECSADVDDDAFVRRITDAHRAGRIPALVIHCSMHSYRALQTDPWREFLGVTSKRHTRAHNVGVKFTAADHPVVQGLAPTWTTPTDELYVIDKLWPGTTALATAVSPEDQQEYPVVWAHDFGGARVFGTTLGHGNETWADPVFQDLLRRGFRWAVNR
jgi:type 1 glutamine amidotransferase